MIHLIIFQRISLKKATSLKLVFKLKYLLKFNFYFAEKIYFTIFVIVFKLYNHENNFKEQRKTKKIL